MCELVSRRVIAVLAACLISMAALVGQVAMSEAGSRTVALKDLAFSPKRVSINKGSTVKFQFLEPDTDHNVTSVGSKRFKTIANRTTGTVKRTFTRGGIYRYECTLHPGMTGRITVR